MHRRSLLRMLDRYASLYPDEGDCVARVRELVEVHPDCFQRTCRPGHVTASAWIVSPDHTRCLFTHHRKLGRWLQLGGHADGDPDVRAVALREAREESGMRHFDWLETGAEGVPFDLDVHLIPARAGEAAHEHHDVRFLLRARPGQQLQQSDESNDLRWFTRTEIGELVRPARDESLGRLERKVLAALSRPELRARPAAELPIPCSSGIAVPRPGK